MTSIPISVATPSQNTNHPLRLLSGSNGMALFRLPGLHSCSSAYCKSITYRCLGCLTRIPGEVWRSRPADAIRSHGLDLKKRSAKPTRMLGLPYHAQLLIEVQWKAETDLQFCTFLVGLLSRRTRNGLLQFHNDRQRPVMVGISSAGSM